MSRRRASSSPSRGVTEAIKRRLAARECPMCGVAVAEIKQTVLSGGIMRVPMCANGHRQDIWTNQRPGENK